MPPRFAIADLPSGHEQHIVLPDGRRLCYAIYGDPRGRPVFFFHGFPGSHLQARPAAPLLARLGLRLIAPDRPGFGGSDYQPRRRLLDWPDDVAMLARALGLGRFSVLGISGGAPYALACAYKLPAQLRGVALVSGLGPMNERAIRRGTVWYARAVCRLARHAPLLYRLLFGLLLGGVGRRHPEWVIAALSRRSPDVDKMVLDRRQVADTLHDSIREALRQGARGAVRDLWLLCQPWGFDPGRIKLPVQLWYGEMDGTVPATHGHYLAARLPRARPRFFRDEGHFSLLYQHMEEILGDLGG